MEETLNAEIWCADCQKFTPTHLRNLGNHTKGKNNLFIIFKWFCTKCYDSDVEEMSSQDWEAIKIGKLTHFKFR